MPHSSSILSYPDVREVLDRVLEGDKGLRLTFPSHKAAIVFQARCNSFRALDRRENKKIYPEPAHTMHGRSVYDVISTSCIDNTLTIKKISMDGEVIIEEVEESE